MSDLSTTALDVAADRDDDTDVAPLVIETTASDIPEEEPSEPWTPQRLARLLTPLFVIGLFTGITLAMMHPDLILRNSTPTGGDMGAHVWGPAYLRDHLLNNFQLNGWSMDWYSGLPVYRFYMVIPALLIVLLDVVLPYGVAFKIVVVLGILTFPVCCWAFGRLARLPFPVPELLSIAGFIYLWDESYTIYGGNIASTMAGEFSFSIALSLAVLGFGLFARGLQTGERRATTAIVLALAVLCHGIVAIYVAIGLILMGLLYLDRSRWRYIWTTIGTMSLLASFWIVPFVLNHQYMTDMKYHGEPGSGSFTSYWDMFFHLAPFWNILFTTLAVIGLVGSVMRRNLIGVWLGVTGLVMVAFVYLFRDSLPFGFGLLWNPRLIPMVNLTRYFLAAIGVWEIVRFGVRHYQLQRFARLAVAGYPTPPPEVAVRKKLFVASIATVVAVTLLTLVCWGWRFQKLPFGSVLHPDGQFQYAWGPFRGPQRADSTNRGFVDGWASWNFKGYEGKPSYGEYNGVVQTMAGLGADPAHGCGRALWENYEGNNSYGTTMALMLLPFWTDGCIGSSEGLFFEASGTTPYHFLAAAAMSKKSSNPVRELRYIDNDASVGVSYLQDLGIRYYMAVTPEAIAKADQQPELTPVAQSGPWHIYEVAGSEIVSALNVQPVVVNERSGDRRERWLEVGTSWMQNTDDWAALPASEGPDDWQRIDVAPDAARQEGTGEGDPARKVDVVAPATPIDPVALPEATVSDVEIGEQSVKFHVDEVGVPVLVRVSYFPNWKVSGADGPYRVAPNMMVVVPTSQDVELHFDRSPTDYAAYVLTFFGLVAVFVLWRRGPVRHPNQAPHLIGGDPDPTLDPPTLYIPPAEPAWRPPPSPLVDDLGEPGDPDGPNTWTWEARPGPGEIDPTTPAGMTVAPPVAPPAPVAPVVATATAGAAAATTGEPTTVEPPSTAAAPPATGAAVAPDEDVSAGLRIPPGIDMSTTEVDPASVDLAWFDRYTTGEVPVQPPPAEGPPTTATAPADPADGDESGPSVPPER